MTSYKLNDVISCCYNVISGCNDVIDSFFKANSNETSLENWQAPLFTLERPRVCVVIENLVSGPIQCHGQIDTFWKTSCIFVLTSFSDEMNCFHPFHMCLKIGYFWAQIDEILRVFRFYDVTSRILTHAGIDNPNWNLHTKF